MISAVAIAALFALAAAIGGVEVLGLVIALTYAAQFSPAAWSVLVAEELSGVSRPTWIMGFGEAVIWATYGAYLGDRALLFGGAGAALMSAIVLVGLTARPASRDRRQRVPVNAR